MNPPGKSMTPLHLLRRKFVRRPAQDLQEPFNERIIFVKTILGCIWTPSVCHNFWKSS